MNKPPGAGLLPIKEGEMGLDAVELVMSVEDAFHISISDEEASKTTTVGALYELVLSKVKIKDVDDEDGSRRCLTSAAFYRIRRAMVAVLHIERRKITPKTALSDLLPTPRRRESWGRIVQATNLKMPGLQHNWWVILAKSGILVAIGVAAGISKYAGGITGLTVMSLIVAYNLARFFPALHISLPASTVGTLAEKVYLANVQKLSEEIGALNKQELWDVLKKIIVEQLGVKPEEVTPAARFIEDLHIS